MRARDKTTGDGSVPATEAVRGVTGAEPFRLHVDPRSGIIHTAVGGFWAIADADLYFERLGLTIATARHRGAPVRVLVDRRESPVQSPDVAVRMRQANRDLYAPGDRLAIVVGSNLARMQVQRLFSHEGSQAFLSLAAAHAWLARP